MTCCASTTNSSQIIFRPVATIVATISAARLLSSRAIRQPSYTNLVVNNSSRELIHNCVSNAEAAIAGAPRHNVIALPGFREQPETALIGSPICTCDGLPASGCSERGGGIFLHRIKATVCNLGFIYYVFDRSIGAASVSLNKYRRHKHFLRSKKTQYTTP